MAAGLSLLIATSGRGPTFAAEPLASVSFAVGEEGLFEVSSPGGGLGTSGHWTFERGRMVDGRIELHFEIEPARQTLPVKSGPAVLFAGLHLSGDAGGDMGIGVAVPTVAHAVIDACDDDAFCRYSVDIAIPTAELPEAIRRLERGGELMSVSAELTLVRTYGAGQWLEVLPFLSVPEGIKGAAAGRLGAMAPAAGQLFGSGLFPAVDAKPIAIGESGFAKSLDYPAIVEQLRTSAGDASSALAMVEVDLHVRVEPACAYYTELWLHDDGRNHLFNTLAYGKRNVDARTTMPVGLPWYLTLAGGGGVTEPAARLGPIVSEGSQVEVRATYDCEAWTGGLELTGAAAPTPTAAAPSASPGAPPSATFLPTPQPTPETPSPTSTTDATGALLVVAMLVLAAGAATALAVRRGWLWRRSA